MRASTISQSIAVAPCAFLLAAASVTAEQREIRDIVSFDSIVVGGGIDLHVRQADDFRVEVVAAGDDATDIRTELDGRTLEIGNRSVSGFFNWSGGGDVYVSLPVLRSLTANGGSDIESDGTLTADMLEVQATGGSDVRLELDVDRLEVQTSGGSDTTLTGRADSARMQSSGGSDLNAFGLSVAEADVASSGGSDVTITVTERLKARASGGSDITYAGNPGVTDLDSSGGADVDHR